MVVKLIAEVCLTVMIRTTRASPIAILALVGDVFVGGFPGNVDQ